MPGSTAVPLAGQQRGDPPVADWRGFHLALRHAALAATQSGAPLSLLLLELAGRARSGPTSGADGAPQAEAQAEGQARSGPASGADGDPQAEGHAKAQVGAGVGAQAEGYAGTQAGAQVGAQVGADASAEAVPGAAHKPAGPAPDGRARSEMVGRIDAVAGVIATELGGTGALARYAEECLAVVMMGTDLSDALLRAERIGSLSSSVAGEARLPAIGVAQFRDDESLGHLIERAAEALGRAKADGGWIAAASPRARRRPLRGCEHCACGLPAHTCLCRRV